MDKCPMEPAPELTSAADDRPVVAIFRSPLFNISETFVRLHAESLVGYRPLLVGLKDKGNVPPGLRQAVLVPRGPIEQAAARLGNWQGVARRLGADRPALVHAHFGPDALAAMPLARALGVPLIATLHGYDVTRSRARMLLSGRLSWTTYALRERYLQQDCGLFLTVSDALRTAALARGFPEERTQTHYLGVDLDRFQGGGTREPDLILHVGRLVEKKGTGVLIDALRLLPAARLIVIGDGPRRSRLEEQAGDLGERVRFLGSLPPGEVAHWMRRAAVLAAPSVTARDGDAEGLPTVIVEASASGLPTLGTRHSGIPEAVVDGETGFLVPERDAEALAVRLATLLGSRDLRERMGAAARRLAEATFDVRIQTDKLEDIYDRVRGQMRPWCSR